MFEGGLSHVEVVLALLQLILPNRQRDCILLQRCVAFRDLPEVRSHGF